MACQPIDWTLPDGTRVTGIVCGVRAKRKACAGCGRRAERECDWKLTGKRAGKTCDRGICLRCTSSPAPGKDLCPAHARLWAEHPANHNAAARAALKAAAAARPDDGFGDAGEVKTTG